MIKRTYVDTWEEPTSFEEFIEEIEYSEVAQRPCVVCGTVGTWQGDRAICAKRFDNLKDAIYACVKPCGEVVISQRASNIIVDGYRHDGTNHFEIHVLNDKGVRADENRCNLSRREYQLALKDYVI
nr:MAG TPA: hypothetical protein [Caudoviricetes sp.]